MQVHSWSQIRASWLVSRLNVCTLRSIVTTNRRSITLLFNHQIQSLNVSYPQPIETIKPFRRWTHEISLLPSVPMIFPRKQKFFLQSCPKEFIRFFCEYKVNLLKGNLQSKKRHQVTKFQNEVWLLFRKKNNLKAKKIGFGFRKMFTTNESCCPSRH